MLESRRIAHTMHLQGEASRGYRAPVRWPRPMPGQIRG